MSSQVKPDKQLAELGIFVHGVLAAFHALGAIYNLRRNNKFDVVAHTAAMIYDCHAVVKHARDVEAFREANK